MYCRLRISSDSSRRGLDFQSQAASEPGSTLFWDMAAHLFEVLGTLDGRVLNENLHGL